MTTPAERYPDLIDGRTDAALRDLVGDLDAACAAALPPQLRASIDRAVYAAVDESAAQPWNTPAPPPTRRRWPRIPTWAPRRITVPAALVAAVLVAGIAYAAAPLVDQALSTSPGTGQIVQQNLGQAVNIAQSACGYTLTINHLYADANLAVIGYTVSGPAGRRFLPAAGRVVEDLPSPDGLPTTVDVPTLITEQGKQFWADGIGGSGTLGNAGGQYLAFDTSTIAPGARVLTARLTIPAIQMFEQLGGGAPATVACESYSPMRDSQGYVVNGRLTAIMKDQGRVVTVQGPFTFDLTIPVSPGVRDYAPHQTVRQADGTVVTLERVVVTRTDTRLYLSTTAPGNIYPALTVDQPLPAGMLQGPMLSPHGGQTTYGAPAIRFFRGTQMGEYAVDAALYDYHGLWTLSVQTNATGADQGRLQIHTAPAVFHFTMP